MAAVVEGVAAIELSEDSGGVADVLGIGVSVERLEGGVSAEEESGTGMPSATFL